MTEFINSLISNDITGGIMGGSIMISIFYWLRDVPLSLYRFLKWKLTTQLVIFSEDVAFRSLDEWLSNLDQAKNARTMRITSKWSTSQRRSIITVTFGLGTHIIWYKYRPILIRRELATEKNISMSYKREETIIITTIGRSSKFILTFQENSCIYAGDELKKLIKSMHIFSY